MKKRVFTLAILVLYFELKNYTRKGVSMIKNIVFDIGNVLVDFRWKEFLIEKGFSEDILKRVIRASVASPYWEEFDRGDYTEEEVMAKFVEIDPEIEKELHIAYDSIERMLLKRDFAIPWVKGLKTAGYNVYYLSNYSKKAYEECQDTIDFMKYTDGGLLSFQEHLIKPDARIYELLLSRYGILANESVFIDDTEKNVLAAKELGFYGIVYNNLEDTLNELKALGVDFKMEI